MSRRKTAQFGTGFQSVLLSRAGGTPTRVDRQDACPTFSAAFPNPSP